MELERVAAKAKEIKLVVSDLDGTLIYNHAQVTERNILAVKALREKGIHFALDTGRDFFSLQQPIKSIELTGPIIVSGGSKIVDAQSGDVIWSRTIDVKALRKLAAELIKADLEFFVEDGTRCWLSRNSFFEKWVTDLNKELLEGRHKTVEICYFDPRGNLEELLDAQATKMVVCFTNDGEAEFIEAAIKAVGLEGKKGGADSFDILPQGVNKAAGLAQLARLYGLEREQCAVFGDFYNDISMLEWAGLSFAMENAVDEAKAVADLVIDAAKNDGVALCLESFFLQ